MTPEGFLISFFVIYLPKSKTILTGWEGEESFVQACLVPNIDLFANEQNSELTERIEPSK
jgi:hypothetical protein